MTILPPLTWLPGTLNSQVILVGGSVATLDGSLLTYENSLSADTVSAGTSLAARRVEDDLAAIGLFLESTIDITELEN